MLSMIASRSMGAFDHITESSATALTQITRVRRLRTQLREDRARDADTGVIATSIIHEFYGDRATIGHLAEEIHKKDRRYQYAKPLSHWILLQSWFALWSLVRAPPFAKPTDR